MKDKVFIDDWLELKPYEKQTVTDSYYLKLSNNVKHAITTNKQWFVLRKYLQIKDIDYLACFLTSYFEDIISKTNIWNTFIKIHKRLYNKPLPFYNIAEYYEEEINLNDIKFLIWYYVNTTQNEKFVSPYNEFIVEIAKKVMALFEEAWDYAPENEHLKPFYKIADNVTDYYEARNLIDTILFKSYLLYPDVLLDYNDGVNEIIENNKSEEHLMMYLNDYRDNTLYKTNTRLLNLKGKDWVAELLGNKHPLSSDYLNISQKISGFFFYKGQNDDNIFIEHIASGKKFDLTKKSFDQFESLKDIDSILFMGIAQWKNEWWFSGIFFQQPFNADLILDEKNSHKSRADVNFLDHENEKTNELLEMQLKAFKDFNNGSQIAFLPSDKIEDFFKKYIEYFNNTLNLTEKQKKKASQRVKDDGFFGTDNESADFSDVSETGLAFFNPKSGAEIALAVNSAFPLPNNPYFIEDDSEEHIKRLVMDESISVELSMYCIDNCKTNLPFFNDGFGKMFLNDSDFMLRFLKNKSYHTKPTITYTGQHKKE